MEDPYLQLAKAIQEERRKENKLNFQQTFARNATIIAILALGCVLAVSLSLPGVLVLMVLLALLLRE